jgi:cyclomaltodextrinase / maltogenic alpha-amylase / neopullulanase
MTVPGWVQDSVFYQIFPDRFANGDLANDPPNVQPWGAIPTTWGFQGGDLRGIIQRFDYLLDLGITALYLNPIFQASSNHRYNATDYYKIDPKLGDLADFHALLDVAHRNQVRVIIDGVFNHCGRGFFAFSDVLENQEHSPYLDWFHIKNFPVDGYSPGDAHDYLGWWNIKSLPKFNTDNPLVRSYLLDVARYWIEQGADGWRLDVPNEIDDDAFWEEFRQVVKSANPEAYILGEIWQMDRRWVGERHFDGLMNYPFRDAVLRLLYAGILDIPHFMDKLESLMHYYPSEHAYAMYLPLGSHDTERLFTKLDEDLEKTRLAFLLLFTFPGAPAVYYGDEIGLQGGKDPGCRAAFPWDRARWDNDLRAWVKQLIALRKAQPALRRGAFQRVCSDSSDGCCAYLRFDHDQSLLVSVNASPETRTVNVPLEMLGWNRERNPSPTPASLLYNSNTQVTIAEGMLSLKLPPWRGEVIGS